MNTFESAQGPWGGLPPLSDLFDVGMFPMLMATVGDLLWAVAYVFFVIIGFRQRTFAVPLLAVCLNFSWEAAFLVLSRPEQIVVLIPHIAWLLIDVLIVYQAIRYGKEAQSDPTVKKYFYLLFVVLGIMSLAGEQTMHRTLLNNSLFPDPQGHTVAFIINLIMSFLFISFLMGRPDMRGISIVGAWTKMVGTGLISAANVLVFLEGRGREFEVQIREIPPAPDALPLEWQQMGEVGGSTLNFGFYYFLSISILLVDLFYIYLVHRRHARLKAAAIVSRG